MTEQVRIIDDRNPPAQWAIKAAPRRGALGNLRAALTEIANDNAAWIHRRRNADPD